MVCQLCIEQKTELIELPIGTSKSCNVCFSCAEKIACLIGYVPPSGNTRYSMTQQGRGMLAEARLSASTR